MRVHWLNFMVNVRRVGEREWEIQQSVIVKKKGDVSF